MKDERTAVSSPAQFIGLSCAFDFGGRLRVLHCLGLGSKFLFGLGGDGIGIHLVSRGRIPKHIGSIVARGSEDNRRLYDHARECAFIGSTSEGRERLAHATLVSVVSFSV